MWTNIIVTQLESSFIANLVWHSRTKCCILHFTGKINSWSYNQNEIEQYWVELHTILKYFNWYKQYSCSVQKHYAWQSAISLSSNVLTDASVMMSTHTLAQKKASNIQASLYLHNSSRLSLYRASKHHTYWYFYSVKIQIRANSFKVCPLALL